MQTALCLLKSVHTMSSLGVKQTPRGESNSSCQLGICASFREYTNFMMPCNHTHTQHYTLRTAAAAAAVELTPQQLEESREKKRRYAFLIVSFESNHKLYILDSDFVLK